MLGRDIELSHVSMTFPNGFTAVHPTDLTIGAGEFYSILGSSGCGKTTILRIISGFQEPSGGLVKIGDETMNGIPPNKRPTALIFQNLALFPLMSVWENVAFALEARGETKAVRRKRADELLEMVALTEHAEKKPAELSGGQKQRVAIARALAVEPAVLLLDEPLSALDLKLRQHMRSELKAIQRQTSVTFVYITHDQGEALAMSDRVAVMNAGRIEQVDTPEAIYNTPATLFAASFVGEQNVFTGKVTEVVNGTATVDTGSALLLGINQNNLQIGEQATVLIRPERIQVKPQNFQAGDDSNTLSANLTQRNLEGSIINLQLQSGENALQVHLPNSGEISLHGASEYALAFRHKDTLIMRSSSTAS